MGGTLAPLALALCAATGAAEPIEVEMRAVLSFEGDIAPMSTVGATGLATLAAEPGTHHLTSLRVPADLLSGAFVTSFALPTLPFTGLQLEVEPWSAAVTFRRVEDKLQGTLPLPGLLRLCMVGTCGFISAPLSDTVVTTIDDETQTVRFGAFNEKLKTIQRTNGLFGTISLTVNGAWTTGPLTFNGAAGPAGFAHGPRSETLSSTVATDGVIQFVAPLVVKGNVFGSDYELPLVARLAIELVPEPRVTVAAILGAALLLLLEGLRRRR